MLNIVEQLIEDIQRAREEADQESKGSVEDLCNILLKTIKEFQSEDKGRDWILDHYWVPYPDRKISNWKSDRSER